MGYKEAAEQFANSETIKTIDPFGNGNINKTYRVTLNTKTNNRFILQKLNSHVFKNPQRITENIHQLNNHINQHFNRINSPDNRRWEMTQLLPNRDGKRLWESSDTCWWRALSYIENAKTHETIHTLDQAYEVGYGLGLFHTLCSNAKHDLFTPTIQRFHNTPSYYDYYNTISSKLQGSKSSESTFCHIFIDQRCSTLRTLEDAKKDGILKNRLIHGDPKINNIMFDNESSMAISIIDLDTIMPGLIQYDIGDCLRSGCNQAGEETDNLPSIAFDTDILKAILTGYITIANQFLSRADYDFFYEAIRLISFELGLRYFTDYLEGNVYFRANYPEHNLQRALNQFQLTTSIEQQKETIQKVIRELIP